MDKDKQTKLDRMVSASRKINEIIKPHRPVPRLMIGLYGYLLFEVVMWGMGVPGGLSGSQAALVSTIVTAGAGFFGLYVNSKDDTK
jgi:hypothetical protein